MKKLFLFMATLCLMLLSSAQAEAASIEGWALENESTYETKKATYTVCYSEDGTKCWIKKIKLHSDEEDVSTFKVKSSFEDVPVTRIGAYNEPESDGEMRFTSEQRNVFHWQLGEDAEEAQNNEEVKKIVLPDSIEEILHGCFFGLSNLKEINTPKELRCLEAIVFWNCDKLKTFYIGDKVEEVNFHSFSVAKSLKQIKVSKKNKTFKSQDKMILSKDGKVLWNLTSDCDKVAVPKTVRTIKEAALGVFSVKEIALPKRLKEIEGGALDSETLSKVSLAKGNKNFKCVKGCLMDKKKGTLIFAHYEKGTLEIPEGVKYLMKGISFAGVGKIKTIIIPKSVKSMGNLWYSGGNYEYTKKVYFRGKNPPKLPKKYSEWGLLDPSDFYVPQKSYKKYRKWLKKNLAFPEYCTLNGKDLVKKKRR